MTSPRHRRSGLTLVELLISLAVASISVIGIAFMMTTVWRAASEGKYQAAASNIARLSVERMRGDADYFTQVLTAAGPTTATRSLKVDGSLDTDFLTNITTTPLAGSGNAYYSVRVLVSWSQEHRTRQVILETILPQP